MKAGVVALLVVAVLLVPIGTSGHLPAAQVGSPQPGVQEGRGPLVAKLARGPSQAGTGWTNVTAPGPTPFNATSTGVLAADGPDRDLLFAGSSTWAYSKGAWAQVDAFSPYPYAMAPYTTDGTVYAVAGSGCGEGCGSDTLWTYSAGSWTQVTPSGTSPPNGIYQRLAFSYGSSAGLTLEDATNHSKWLLTWGYEVETNSWTNETIDGIGASPIDRIGFALSYDRLSGGLDLFGGQAYNATRRSTTPDILGDFWTTNGLGDWYNTTSSSAYPLPPGRADASLAPVSQDDQAADLVLFGGYNLSASGTERPYSDTWVLYAPGGWANVTGLPSPRATQWPASDGGLVFWNGTTFLLGGCYVPDGAPVGSPCYPANDTWTYPFTPGGPITPVLSCSPQYPMVGQLVSFNVSLLSGGTPPYTYSWRFGDGGTTPSHAIDPTHVFNSSGYFVVHAWVNDSYGGSGLGQYNATVSLPLSVSISPPFSVRDVGQPLELSALVSGGTGVGSLSYAWTFGDGSSSETGDHTYASPGLYSVRAWVNDSLGGSATASASVLVSPALVMCTLSATPDPAVLGQPVTFACPVSEGSSPDTFAWNFGDGGLGGNLSTITHVYETNGPFMATVTVTDMAGIVAHSSVNISIALEAALSAESTALSVGASDTITPVISGGTPPYTVAWPNLPAWCHAQASGAEGVVCTPTSAGTFKISAQVTDAKGATVSASVQLLVTGPSQAAPTGLLGLPGNEGVFLVVGVVVAAVAALSAWAFVRRRATRIADPELLDEPVRSDEPTSSRAGPV